MTKRDGLPPKKRGRPPADPDNPKGPGRDAKNRHPGSGKPPHNGPARAPAGIAGWGGPARGGEARNGPPRELIHGPIGLPRGADGRILPTERSLTRQQAADRAFAHLAQRMEVIASNLPTATIEPAQLVKLAAMVEALGTEHQQAGDLAKIKEIMAKLVENRPNPMYEALLRENAVAVMNRAEGAPTTKIETRRITSIEDLTDEELEALAAADRAGKWEAST